MRRLDLWAAACGGLCPLAGCGEKDPFSYQKVSGKVTYEDGSLIPVPAIQLTFSPLAKSDDPKRSTRPPASRKSTWRRASSRRSPATARGRHPPRQAQGDVGNPGKRAVAGEPGAAGVFRFCQDAAGG